METWDFPVFPRSNGQGPLLPRLRWSHRPRRERPRGAQACITLPHLFASREVPFLLGLQPGGLSPGAEGPPEDRGLVRGPPAAGSPEFCLLQYSEGAGGTEPRWLKAGAEGSRL